MLRGIYNTVDLLQIQHNESAIGELSLKIIFEIKIDGKFLHNFIRFKFHK